MQTLVQGCCARVANMRALLCHNRWAKRSGTQTALEEKLRVRSRRVGRIYMCVYICTCTSDCVAGMLHPAGYFMSRAAGTGENLRVKRNAGTSTKK